MKKYEENNALLLFDVMFFLDYTILKPRDRQSVKSSSIIEYVIAQE